MRIGRIKTINMDLEEGKFYNILMGLKIDKLSKEIIDILIAKNIILKNNTNIEDSYKSYSKETQELFKQNSTELEKTIRFNNNEYEINDELIEEIYYSLQYIIESPSELEWEISEIEIELEGIIENDIKLKYLQDKHFTFLSEVKKEPEYLVYIGKKEFQGYRSWIDMMSDLLRHNDDLIISYLTNGFAFSLNNTLYEDWLRYYKVKYLTDICKMQIQNIQNPTLKESKHEQLDTSKKVMLIEEIRNITNWEDLSANKKGIILSYLLGRNKDNIKDVYLSIDKKQSENTDKFKSDSKYIKELVKKILG